MTGQGAHNRVTAICLKPLAAIAASSAAPRATSLGNALPVTSAVKAADAVDAFVTVDALAAGAEAEAGDDVVGVEGTGKKKRRRRRRKRGRGGKAHRKQVLEAHQILEMADENRRVTAEANRDLNLRAAEISALSFSDPYSTLTGKRLS